MLRYRIFSLALFLMMTTSYATTIQMPNDFVNISDVDATIIQSHRYTVSENFLGRPVPGYHAPIFCATKPLADALKKVNADAKKLGYKLVIYDAYRPQRAVNTFVAWVNDEKDTLMKELYYPTLNKSQILKDGYIFEKSAHSRGSTVDVTLIPLEKSLKPIALTQRTLSNGETIPYLDDNTVDMGSSFDLFHPASHHDSPYITSAQTKMRQLLRSLMHTHGFDEIKEEWWHYTLHKEPYPNTYFDFTCE